MMMMTMWGTTATSTRTRTTTSHSGWFRWTRLPFWLCLLLLLLLQFVATKRAVAVAAAATPPPDIVAIAPDRSTAYPNGLHNGLWLSAKRFNVTLEVRTVGNFDPLQSAQVLQNAIDTPTEQQPAIYCIWPIDMPSRQLLQQLYDKHKVPIIQMNQLPSASTGQWEWDHLYAYAGPNDALRARNAGLMFLQALVDTNDVQEEEEEKDTSFSLQTPPTQPTNVVALGYPETYGGYHLSMDAFSASLQGTSVQIAQRLPLDWGTQPAYEAVLRLMQDYQTVTAPQKQQRDSSSSSSIATSLSTTTPKNTKPILHGIYAMDDSILLGAYQALMDLGLQPGVDVILVGTVCNGARELLESGAQYGTTVQSPMLEGKLAMTLAKEYLDSMRNNGNGANVTTTTTAAAANRIHFTPNPIATGATWDTMFVDFLGEASTVDELCTWNLFYERVAGPTNVNLVEDICTIVHCEYIPRGLFVVGYFFVITNYGLAVVCAVLLYIYREKKIIGIAQPFFLALVIVGSMVDTTSIWYMSRDNRNYSDNQLDFACAAWPVLLSVGHMITTATLVAKVYRVKILVDAGSRLARVQVTVRQVSGFILLFVSFDVVVLLVWFLTDPFSWRVDAAAEDLSGYVTQANGVCASSNEASYMYPLIIGVLHLAVLVYANVLAYQTSAYHKISDSKSVAIALFNSIQLLLIGAPILALVGDNVATSYLIRICFVFLNNFGVLVLIVLPKLYLCIMGAGDVLPEVDFKSMRQSKISRASPVLQSSNGRSSGRQRDSWKVDSWLKDGEGDVEDGDDDEGQGKASSIPGAAMGAERAPSTKCIRKSVSFAESGARDTKVDNDSDQGSEDGEAKPLDLAIRAKESLLKKQGHTMTVSPAKNNVFGFGSTGWFEAQLESQVEDINDEEPNSPGLHASMLGPAQHEGPTPKEEDTVDLSDALKNDTNAASTFEVHEDDDTEHAEDKVILGAAVNRLMGAGSSHSSNSPEHFV